MLYIVYARDYSSRVPVNLTVHTVKKAEFGNVGNTASSKYGLMYGADENRATLKSANLSRPANQPFISAVVDCTLEARHLCDPRAGGECAVPRMGNLSPTNRS